MSAVIIRRNSQISQYRNIKQLTELYCSHTDLDHINVCLPLQADIVEICNIGIFDIVLEHCYEITNPSGNSNLCLYMKVLGKQTCGVDIAPTGRIRSNSGCKIFYSEKRIDIKLHYFLGISLQRP